MTVNAPLISVVMTTYNHEKYVGEAIQSVLNQTFTDFEFIIVNDGSIDRTDEIIRNFRDERIVYIYQENQGPSVATNNAVLAAKGKYIALFAGDDVCYPHRLEKQYDFLSKSKYKITFSSFELIDDDSNSLVNELIDTWFTKENKARSEIINLFFFRGNVLNGITAMVEREILFEVGLFHITSIQLQDFDMWIKLLKHYELFISSEKLIKYRIREGNKNLSSSANYIRTNFELYQIYKSIFDNMPIELFKEAFSKYLKKPNFREGAEYELEKAFMYLNHSLLLMRSIGCEKLFNLLQAQTILSISKAEYNFGLAEFYALTKNMDITNSSIVQQTQRELERAQAWIQQLQQGKDWLQSQYNIWQQKAQEAQSEWERAQVWIQQLQEGKDWLQSQYDICQQKAQEAQSEWERS